MSEFRKPEVLGEQYNPEEEQSFRQGMCTIVKSLEDLPPNIKERIPDLEESEYGYVIKKYNDIKDFDPNYSEQDSILFGEDDIPLSTKNPKEYNLVDQAEILRRRQEELRRYFGDLEDVITQSYFFVAKDEKNEFFVYELQKRLPDYETLKKFYVGLFEEPPSDLDNFSSEQKVTLAVQVRKLIKILEKLLEEKEDFIFSKFIPDFHAGNIAIGDDGNMHLFDTNYWAFQDSGEGGTRGKVRGSIKALKKLVDILEEK